MAFGAFYLRDAAGSPERVRWLHLACSGSQSQRTIWFILPTRGASHIINLEYSHVYYFKNLEMINLVLLLLNDCSN